MVNLFSSGRVGTADSSKSTYEAFISGIRAEVPYFTTSSGETIDA